MSQCNRLKEQYKTSENLDIRIAIHQRYSTNKQGFNNWIFSQYDLSKSSRILDLGCGNSIIWKDNWEQVPAECQLVLTDFSKGMLEASQHNLGLKPNLSFLEADIQKLPFEDNSFDIITANMVFFHLPDLRKGLKEIKRVLKPNGVFYTATFGEHGISQTLGDWLKDIGKANDSPDIFTLQNGGAKLENYFNKVERLDYQDSPEVTRLEDLIDYLYSLPEVFELEEDKRELVFQTLSRHTKDGVLTIPKEYGVFICR
ncbi:class I SAM-dependent methyltransferase [Streptococcus henryi]|uniref:class I SAM-dependent methyltransferase n=1 Tax=Streptococcus henryi TaxID=439219 RepID=UPI00037A9F6A|nr:class I SAM-dependent methyltransferase [Streptococcus henryi]